MKKILHIIDSLAVGGAEKLLVGMINELDGEFEQHLVLLHGPEPLHTEIKVACKTTNLECNSFKDIFRKQKKLKRYIREHKIDIIHSHLYESNLLGRLATPKTIKLINSIHAITSLASYKVNRMTLYLEKLSYKKRHVLVAVSKAVLDDFDKWVGVKGKSYVLYNFIEEKFFQPVISQKPATDYKLNLVAVGNLRWQKNYPYLLEAFKKIPASVHLDIYGEGDLRNELQQEIDKHKLHIRLCGIHQGMENILPRYDAFVMSSFYEGQPVSLLEAIACGLPPVLSDIPVLREVTGDDAVYFDIKNPDSFVEAIKGILNNKYDLRQIAEAGKKKISGFAHKSQYIKKLNIIYQECLAE